MRLITSWTLVDFTWYRGKERNFPEGSPPRTYENKIAQIGREVQNGDSGLGQRRR
jgi:hypothetical protein